MFPFLLTAGWVKHGNGFISEDSLGGQKRFLPEENSLIVESKDYVLKFDLTTGEIIKKIDIIETDSTYKNAVANDDLSEIYILTENFFQNPNNSNIYYFIFMIKDYKTQKVLYLDTIHVTYANYYYSVDMDSYFHFNNEKVFYSIKHSTITYLGWTSESTLRILSTTDNDTLSLIGSFGGRVDSYSFLNPFNKISYFTNHKSEIRTKGLQYEKYLNQLLVYNDESESVNEYKKNEESSSYSNIVNGKTTNNHIYGYKGKLILIDSRKTKTSNLKYGLATPITFTANDNYLFIAFPFIDQPYQNGVSIQTLEGEVIFRDTIPIDIPRELAFDDGKTFYFQKDDRLFKYEPDFLKSSNLKVIISDISDTLNFAEEFYVESHSSGSPNSYYWYIDNKLISNESSVSHSIGSLGNHRLKLVVENEEMIDSISKSIYIREIKINDIKKIDYSINLLNSKPIRILFTVNQGYNFQKYYWNFGDGFTDTGKKVSHTYLDTGTYSVTLTGIREDGSFDQEIKNNLISNESVDPDYKSNLFQKFELRDDDLFYFKSTKTLFDVKVTVVDKNNVILFNEFYKVLSESEIKSIRKPLDNEYIIILENKNGDVYEY